MNLKSLILFTIMSLYIFQSRAQPKLSISGKISNAVTGEALPGASINIPDLKRGVVANAEGNYVISNISAGKHLVEITHLGFAPVIESIDIGSNTQKDFSLTPSFIENEAVTITGVSSATSTKRTPVPVNIIRQHELFTGISTNLIDNLSKVPGVSQVTTGPAISKPFIRGLGYNRVVVVNDGIRQEGQQWGDEHGIEVDELNVNKVEIFKGPASLMYGSDALAGVMNIISIQPAAERRIEGNIMSGYQTNNRQRSFHADIGGNKEGFIWGLYGSSKAAADYKNKFDGYVFNSKFTEKNFGAYLGLNKNWGFSHVYFSFFSQQPGLVEGERDSLGRFLKLVNEGGVEMEVPATMTDFKTTEAFIPGQDIKHLKYVSDNSFNIGKDRMTIVLGYQENKRKEFANVLDPDEEELFFDLESFNYNLRYHFAEKNQWRFTLGANGMQQKNTNRGEEAVIPDYSLFDIGGFVYAQKRTEKVSFSGGIRLDDRSVKSKLRMEGSDVKFPAFEKNYIDISGSAGFAYDLSRDVTLKMNLARGYRAPNLTELGANGVHEGSFQYIYGNQGLKPESSLQADAGLLASSDHVSFEMNIFYNAIHNYIFLRKLESVSGGDSILNVNGEDFVAFTYRQENARLFGTELNLDIHPHPLDWLHIENSFSWVSGRFIEAEDGSKNLPLIPAARLIDELKVDLFPKGKILRNGFIKLEVDNILSQNKPFTGYNTETPTRGYSLLHAGIGGDIMNKDKKLFSLFFGANNITDVSYQQHLSRLKYAPGNPVTGRSGVFNMGRNFSFKIHVPLDFESEVAR